MTSANMSRKEQLSNRKSTTEANVDLPLIAAAANSPSTTLKKGSSVPELPTSLDEDEEEDSPQPLPNTPFFSMKNLIVAIPIILTPLLYGYNLGFVGPYSTMYGYASNCQLYNAKRSCETLTAAKCRWFNASAYVSNTTYGEVCGWADRTTCFLRYSDEAGCLSDSACKWSYSANTCGNQVGYSSIESGVFAGSLVIGSTMGALMGGYLTKRLDYCKSFMCIGILSVIGNVLTHVATGLFHYWLLFVARIVLGFPLGWQSITSSHYTDKFAPANHAKTLGTLFQVSVSTGIFVTSFFGLVLGNTIQYDEASNANTMGRMQGLVSVSTLLSIFVVFLPLITKDGYSKSRRGDYEEENSEDASRKAAEEYTMTQMIGPILNGVAMGCVTQLTGINANMNFAPTIMSNLGLQPLVGNIIVMTWNMLATFCVIPLSRRFSMRTLFLFCGFVGSLCCVFLGGIPVYPGVTKSDKAVSGIAITGIAIFIALYEMGVGPCFYVLAVDVFPESFRPIGSSITVGVMFIFNLVINICYPIATESISGGPSGNPNKGQAVAFIFFGCIGVVACVVEYFFLQPWEEPGAKMTDDLDGAAVPEGKHD
ncbi:putative glucose transporter/membrane transporter D2 [Leishmania major strain Friedlin]|uniref:Putative glucose transporter/membrane transporter D2 n=1 Tax=Leishmania major TaxID=5664 RepID=Q4Q4J1_LEIMA|nr:putative glucose transporter/membrane transporter D2 [Leishmania major strain Friedlin]CAG9580582.1 glucose_transporter/membrane_transporter_D2_-_putative [Leishmania major strain Friedlin]CAJ05915.1 putative glucose transporter/membrane transporter D2 [Leishmania major strain Friedlin]|eukprot:XP_001685755.1 putative glucose transporter/membrane transporter D2 [Leishmania major strain Friedlin]